jgi:uncharacterized protein (AIM24 family)
MQYEIEHSPAYSLAVISLEPGEQIKAEAGAMVSMSDSIKMDTGTQGLHQHLRR